MFQIFKEVVQAALIFAAIIAALVFMSLPAEASVSPKCNIDDTRSNLASLCIKGVSYGTLAIMLNSIPGKVSFNVVCSKGSLYFTRVKKIGSEYISTDLSIDNFDFAIQLSAASSRNDDMTFVMAKGFRLMKRLCK